MMPQWKQILIIIGLKTPCEALKIGFCILMHKVVENGITYNFV